MTPLEISSINLLMWVLFGLIIGLAVHLLDPGDAKGGIFGTLALGVAGSLLGGLTAAMFFGQALTGANLQNFAIAAIGALVLAIIYRVLFRDRNFIRTAGMKLK